MYGYIYLTNNLINNKKYIGQHKGKFTTEYLGSGKVLKQAIDKYGRDNFKVILLDVAQSKEELDELEKKYITNYNALYESDFYNIHEGGSGGNTKQGYSFEHIDRVFRDNVLASSDKDILRKAFSRNNGASNPSSTTYRLTNTESGREILLGSKSCLAKFLGITIKQANRVINVGYYSPYSIETIGKTKDVSYVSSYSLRRLDNIIRYNNRIKCHTQTVAAHSYYVSYTMMRLLELVDLPYETKYKLLSYSLIHDAAEIHVGDMPHDVKAAYPKIKEMLEQFEDDFYIQSGLSDISNIIKDDYQKIKYNLFKLCDLMDVFMYAKEELYLGNETLEMSHILSQSIEDCNTIVKALRFYNVIPKDFNFIKFLDEIYEVKIITKIKEDAYNYKTEEMEEN